jgi:hypothetical protein
MATGKVLKQYAPWPEPLEAAVLQFRYMEGWSFSLEDIDRDFDDSQRKRPIAGGLTFIIHVPCYDSYHPEVYRPVTHYHPVPAATFNRQSWERWLFDRLMDTIRHEAAEYARFGEEERRPFAPTHGPGDDPYVLHEYSTIEQRSTSFRGEMNDGSS